MGMTINGLEAVMARLEAIQAAVGPAAAAGLAAGAEQVRKTAMELCPEDTGSLRGSIFAQGDYGPGGGTVRLGARAPHGTYVEMGTSKMPARPFLYPALAMNRGNLVRAVAQALKEAL